MGLWHPVSADYVSKGNHFWGNGFGCPLILHLLVDSRSPSCLLYVWKSMWRDVTWGLFTNSEFLKCFGVELSNLWRQALFCKSWGPLWNMKKIRSVLKLNIKNLWKPKVMWNFLWYSEHNHFVWGAPCIQVGDSVVAWGLHIARSSGCVTLW